MGCDQIFSAVTTETKQPGMSQVLLSLRAMLLPAQDISAQPQRENVPTVTVSPLLKLHDLSVNHFYSVI